MAGDCRSSASLGHEHQGDAGEYLVVAGGGKPFALVEADVALAEVPREDLKMVGTECGQKRAAIQLRLAGECRALKS